MRPTNHLVVFVKAPRIGAVKTRLAAGIGAGPAWRFYRDTTRTLLRRIAGDRRWQCHLAVTPDHFAARGRFWPRWLPRSGQGFGDLGRRMDRTMRRLPPGPVVLVGSDIPGIEARHIAAAFRALRDADAVFGPAADGGYWLVGMRRRPRHVDPFRNVPWSSERTLAATLANLDGRHRVVLLETLEDIDDADGYWRCYPCSRSRGISSTKLHGLWR